MPLSATIARADIMNWPPGAHASTFGGNLVSVAAALETIRLIETKYMENARVMGDYIFGRIAAWPERHAIVGDVRGKGLMIGIEIVLDRKTKERAHYLRDAIVLRAFHKGLLILGAGENTVRLSPPLMIDREQADFAVDTLDACIAEVAASAGK
jgi:4-aminobutyrate aminotransferase